MSAARVDQPIGTPAIQLTMGGQSAMDRALPADIEGVESK